MEVHKNNFTYKTRPKAQRVRRNTFTETIICAFDLLAFDMKQMLQIMI